MRNYETVIIWSTSMPDTEVEQEQDRVVEIIGKTGSSYKSSDKWTRRLLAYPIKKQTEGIYHFLKWTGGNDTVAAIDKHLKIHDSCLRYITLRDEKESSEESGGDE